MKMTTVSKHNEDEQHEKRAEEILRMHLSYIYEFEASE